MIEVYYTILLILLMLYVKDNQVWILVELPSIFTQNGKKMRKWVYVRNYASWFDLLTFVYVDFQKYFRIIDKTIPSNAIEFPGRKKNHSHIPGNSMWRVNWCWLPNRSHPEICWSCTSNNPFRIVASSKFNHFFSYYIPEIINYS